MKPADTSDEREAAKCRAGERAAEAVEDGMAVGLGTGSTAAFAIRALGRAVDDGLEVRGVTTSFQSRALALEAGIPLVGLDEVDGLDVTIDGADQVAVGDGGAGGGEAESDLPLVKGGGAAHAREKVVAAASDRLLVVVDDSKLADQLDAPVPLAVLPDAWAPVTAAVRDLGGDPTLREGGGKDGPVVTDDGNLVLDCEFGPIDDPAALAGALSSIPGVVEHGLFVGMADAVYVGSEDGVEVREPV